MARTALLVAGGTGGHLFPALALREVLSARGWSVHVATDPRVGGFVQGVPENETHIIASATLAGGSPAAWVRSVSTMGQGLIASFGLLGRVRPRVVVGFGGYPTVPPLVAARLKGLPIIIHEQNAVVGRANRLLVRAGALLATGFPAPKGGGSASRVEHVGNPVRAAVAREAAPYRPPQPDGPFRLLVFGGSQGARFFSGLVPGALALLPEGHRRRITLVQQARPEELDSTRAALSALAVDAVVEPFFPAMGKHLAAAHLVLCRAGASTVSELALLGRPAILVPYPHALDHDQAENARALAADGGAWIVAERDLDPPAFAERLASLMDAPDRLAAAAEAAGMQGRPDAAERLADLVESAARTPSPLVGEGGS